MAVMQHWSDRDVAQAPMVWRPTLRGVLVLDGDHVGQLEGLAAAVWLVLDDGPSTGAMVLEQLRNWYADVDAGDVEYALAQLHEHGFLRS